MSAGRLKCSVSFDPPGRAGLAQPHDELAVAGELVDVPAALDVVADPDEIVVVDEDAVAVVAPLVIGAVTAPALHHLAGRVELDHRRRRHAADHVRRRRRALFPGIERARALVDPNVVLRIDRDAADGADDPVARQRQRPGRVDREFRRLRQGRARCRSRRGGQHKRRHTEEFSRTCCHGVGFLVRLCRLSDGTRPAEPMSICNSCESAADRFSAGEVPNHETQCSPQCPAANWNPRLPVLQLRRAAFLRHRGAPASRKLGAASSSR